MPRSEAKSNQNKTVRRQLFTEIDTTTSKLAAYLNRDAPEQRANEQDAYVKRDASEPRANYHEPEDRMRPEIDLLKEQFQNAEKELERMQSCYQDRIKAVNAQCADL